MKTSRPPTLHRQRGAVSVAIAMLIMFILAAAVVAVLNMSGSAVIDAAKNEEQVSALFLAESGLERGQGMLSSASAPTASSACTGITGSNFSLGRGTFNLSAISTGCVGNLNCTSCTITSTGAITSTGTSSSRTVVRVLSLAAASGGATGWGGGPTPPPPPDGIDAHKDIVQAIDVTAAPAVLLSNMAYLRHPEGGVTVEAAGCVLVNPGSTTPCITQWNDQSSSSAGNVVVGSRGAGVRIDSSGSYKLKQNLTRHSKFAAVGAKIGGPDVRIIGSYWDDNGNTGTFANSQALTGVTNNGALCDPAGPGPCPTATTPPITIPGAGTVQASTSWCYGADTLVLGFSGRSSNNNNGSLTSFLFGNSPESIAVPNGTATYPTPTAVINSELYSAVRYIYNTNYLSASDAVSGAVVTGSAGATFTGTLDGGTTTMTIALSGVTSGRLSVGDTISGSPTLGGTNNTSTIVTAPVSGLGLDGPYTLQHASSGGNTTTGLSANSSVMYVTSVSTALGGLGNLAVLDTILGTGVTANTTITSLGTGTGGIGSYTLSTAQKFNPTTITSNGMTVNTSLSITTSPTAGTHVAKRWTGSGTGVLASGTTVASLPGPTVTSFKLSARPITPLSGAQICGGICAFFNHSSASAVTTFNIVIPNTQQWAAGMTCLSGVDTSSIAGLTGDSGAVRATNWYEPVR